MTLKHVILVMLAGVLIGCTSTPERAAPLAEPQSHSFGIYQVRFTADKRWDPAMLGEMSALPLAKEPAISDADILSYDFTDRSMLVKRGALSRLPAASVWFQPFVVVADGERVYLGAFASGFSSFSCSVPTILVDFPDSRTELTIYRAYPGPDFGSGPDPRSDERIRTALAGLKKLK